MPKRVRKPSKSQLKKQSLMKKPSAELQSVIDSTIRPKDRFNLYKQHTRSVYADYKEQLKKQEQEQAIRLYEAAMNR